MLTQMTGLLEGVVTVGTLVRPLVVTLADHLLIHLTMSGWLLYQT